MRTSEYQLQSLYEEAAKRTGEPGKLKSISYEIVRHDRRLDLLQRHITMLQSFSDALESASLLAYMNEATLRFGDVIPRIQRNMDGAANDRAREAIDNFNAFVDEQGVLQPEDVYANPAEIESAVQAVYARLLVGSLPDPPARSTFTYTYSAGGAPETQGISRELPSETAQRQSTDDAVG